jgi:hypothetical protein
MVIAGVRPVERKEGIAEPLVCEAESEAVSAVID